MNYVCLIYLPTGTPAEIIIVTELLFSLLMPGGKYGGLTVFIHMVMFQCRPTFHPKKNYLSVCLCLSVCTYERILVGLIISKGVTYGMPLILYVGTDKKVLVAAQ